MLVDLGTGVMSNDDDSKDSLNCKNHENTKMIFIVHIKTFKLTLFKCGEEEATFFLSLIIIDKWNHLKLVRL